MGEVTAVNHNILDSLVKEGYIPVVSTIATDETGQALNINADTAAGEVDGLRVGIAERYGVLCVLKVYWRPQLIIKIRRLFKT